MAVTPPPIKKGFVPFRLGRTDSLDDARANLEITARNFDRLKDAFGELHQLLQTNYVSIPTGGSGGGGGTSTSFDFGNAILGDQSGAEVVLWQRPVEYALYSSPVVFVLVGLIRSASGTATFRLRLGGTDRGVNGTIIAQTTTNSAAFVPTEMSASVLSSGGTAFLKLTITASAATRLAQLKEGGVTIASGNSAAGLGLPGTPGSQGAPGPVGMDGLDGEDGQSGPPGTPGSVGAPGAQGAPGPMGMDGPEGDEGQPGPPGAQGAAGTSIQGPIGVPGLDGEDGEHGPPGPPGIGLQGPAGALGMDGSDGEDGAPGPQGAAGVGLQGPVGVPGWDGEDGDAGPPGAAGFPGAQGAMGMPGADGEDGEGFVGPVGPQGATGATGAAGPASLAVTVGTAFAEVPRKRSGVFLLEPTGGFSAAQVGKPVIVVPAPQLSGKRFDEAEMESVPRFVGEVIDRKRMRVFFAGPRAFGGGVRLNYLIGA